ncbi:unnamed protein product, partial [marine sediment metagenome]
MRKVFVLLLLGVFILSLVSAIELRQIEPIEKIGSNWDNVDKFTKDITTSIYGKYEIRNSILKIPFLKLSKVVDIELKSNSDICGDNCFAEKEITLYNDGILVDEIIFKTRQSDGSWVEQDIRSYHFSYEGQVQDYKTVCIPNKELNLNGTRTETCERVEDGSHYGRINYEEGDVVPAGSYLLRLDGQKKPSRTIDWVINSNGIWTDEWAIWGSIGSGDDAEVI